MLLAIAFVVRLAWGLAAGVTPDGAGFDDAGWYHRTAIMLARGRLREPLHRSADGRLAARLPVVLGVVYRSPARRRRPPSSMNAVFGALTCFLVWRLGTRLAGARVGLVATMLLAFFPSQIFFTALVLVGDALHLPDVRRSLLAGDTAARSRKRRTRGAFGALGALGRRRSASSALVRAEAVAFVLVPRSSRRARRVARERRACSPPRSSAPSSRSRPGRSATRAVFGAFVPTSTSFGRTVWIGHNPDANGGMTVAHPGRDAACW